VPAMYVLIAADHHSKRPTAEVARAAH